MGEISSEIDSNELFKI